MQLSSSANLSTPSEKAGAGELHAGNAGQRLQIDTSEMVAHRAADPGDTVRSEIRVRRTPANVDPGKLTVQTRIVHPGMVTAEPGGDEMFSIRRDVQAVRIAVRLEQRRAVQCLRVEHGDGVVHEIRHVEPPTVGRNL